MKTPYDVIKSPVITENAMDEAAARKYTFKVAKNANKFEIKAAIEEAFGVEIARVNVLNVMGKEKRQGLTKGFTSDYKKAIVTLTPSSKTIEFFEGL